MRPDEHKRKKNATYKKNHGMAKDKTDDASSKEKNNGKGKSKGKHEPGLNTPQQSSQKHNSFQNEESSSSSDSEGVRSNGPMAAKAKVFQRRQIVSNWEKYEVGPDLQADADKGGKDYKELLNMAGETMAHFRFTDELDWDVAAAGEENQTPGTQDNLSSVLSLDPSDLAQSLACLPLHTVLRLSPDIFPEMDLNLAMEKANENMIHYLEKNKAHVSSSMDILEASNKSSLKDTLKSSSSVHGQDSGTLKTDKQKPTYTTAKKVTHKTNPVKNNISELDLDSLLGNSNSDKRCVKEADGLQSEPIRPVSKTIEQPIKTSVQTRELELDLDSLLDDSSSTICREAPTDTGQKADLEDWLDSVLDD